jgi:hypothetical protein
LAFLLYFVQSLLLVNTTLDPLGAFYLVALDEDWDIRPENLNQQTKSAPGLYLLNHPCTLPMPLVLPLHPTTSRLLNWNTNNVFVQIFTRPSLEVSDP